MKTILIFLTLTKPKLTVTICHQMWSKQKGGEGSEFQFMFLFYFADCDVWLCGAILGNFSSQWWNLSGLWSYTMTSLILIFWICTRQTGDELP